MRGYYVVIVAALAVVAAGVPANKIPENLPVKPMCSPSGTYRLPHPQDCALYYICQDGKRMVDECPEGLHFSNVIKQCDFPPVGCFEGERAETQPIVPDTEVIEGDRSRCIGRCPFRNPKDPVHLPYRGDCTKFCKCSHGIPYVMDCPDGLHWDKKQDICNWRDEARCDW